MISVDKLTFVEKSLLSGVWDAQIQEDSLSPAVSLAKSVVGGSFREALTSSYARKLFSFHSISTIQDFDSTVLLTEDETENELLRLVIAIACLHAFVQVNWTGPDLDVKPLDVLVPPSDASLTEQDINQKAIAELAYGGEPAYHLAQHAVFLRLAQILLDTPYRLCQSPVWWRLRTHLTHQQVLDEPVILPEDVLRTFEQWQNPFSDNAELAGRYLLELGLLHHTFALDKLAAEYFVRAARATELQYELSGALGKRTRFQQNELSQLVLLAESHLPDDASKDEATSKAEQDQAAVPETLALNDDTLLEQTEFTSSNPNPNPSSSSSSSSPLHHLSPSNQPPLHPLDQCILLSLCLNVKNTSPLHGLTSEQMSPYVSRVVSHPRNWSVHTMSLLLRSRLESTRTRTVERATLQLQALVDQMPVTDAEAAPVETRLRYFHSIPLPTKWDLEKELAGRYAQLGVTRSALEIYERLEMWEEVVKCYVSLERPERGVEIVKDLLEGSKVESETVISRSKVSSSTSSGSGSTSTSRLLTLDKTRLSKLYCILGDLQPTHALTHYTHAWTLSRHTSARAIRSLGGLHFAAARFTEARECLRKAVKINPLNAKTWFILGCACVRLEDWEGGKEAFGRCVGIDEEDGESWSNLASMYLRIGGGTTTTDGKVEAEAGEDSETEKTQPTTTTTSSSSTSSSPSQTTTSYKHKLLAFRALREGLKRSYSNWRMWSNYMYIAVDIGELGEACRALGRVVEETGNLGSRSGGGGGGGERGGGEGGGGGVVLDEDVLDRLVDAVVRAPLNADDAVEGSGSGSGSTPTSTGDSTSGSGSTPTSPSSGDSASASASASGTGSGSGSGTGTNTKSITPLNQTPTSPSTTSLYPRLLSLFHQTLLPRISTPRVFRAYARLMTWEGKWEDALGAWMDAYREGVAGRVGRGEVEVNVVDGEGGGEDVGRQRWLEAVNEVEEIVDVLRNLGPRVASSASASTSASASGSGSTSGGNKKWKLQARTIVRSFMSRTRENFEDDPEWGRLEGLLEELRHERDEEE